MNRMVNMIIGIMCILPPIALFFVVIMEPVFRQPGDNWREMAHIFGALRLSIGIMILTMLIYSVIYILRRRNSRFKDKASLWMALIVFSNVFVLPIFGYMFFIRHPDRADDT